MPASPKSRKALFAKKSDATRTGLPLLKGVSVPTKLPDPTKLPKKGALAGM